MMALDLEGPMLKSWQRFVCCAATVSSINCWATR